MLGITVAGRSGVVETATLISPSDVVTGRRGGFQTRPYTKVCLDIKYERYNRT